MFRKIFVFVVILVFFTTGCSNENSDMYEVNRSDMTEKLVNINFDYQLPAKLPFEVQSIQANRPPTDQAMFSLAFYGPNGEYLFLDVSNSEIKRESENNMEEVKIGDKTGSYLENDQGAKMLFWKSNGVSYQLSLKEAEEQQGYNKNDLIMVAESFE
ncbi:DUF4367 domain-containing protein [Virgibacillus sp. MSP4-1]|uniref:DUF4367 domain-containing protein n=1 Tax=Virgibacillus sp. MSP4-1 TaxID=2700081 RepID=UPI0003AA681C|nr:DUF4367 domain-containing protein [Virgibacillus sp. MSP4-1]QHS21773.1 DUF4367 domain-containing protein [Virgibacillus sp. MSP4-1]